MPDDSKSFSVLKAWITTFKKQQGRDPLFEDFPANIGAEWKRWKAHKTKSAAGSERSYAVGTHGAVLTASSHAGLCHHHHQPGSRPGLHSQSNPFSRGPIKRQKDTKAFPKPSGAQSKPGVHGAKPSGDWDALQNLDAQVTDEISVASPLKEISLNQQQPVKGLVKGFSQIAAQKQQLGLLHQQPHSNTNEAEILQKQAANHKHHSDAELSDSQQQEGHGQIVHQGSCTHASAVPSASARPNLSNLADAAPVSSAPDAAADLQLEAAEGLFQDQSAPVLTAAHQSAGIDRPALLAQHARASTGRGNDDRQTPHTTEIGIPMHTPTARGTAAGMLTTAAAKSATAVARGSKKRRQPEPDSPDESPHTARAPSRPQTHRLQKSRAVTADTGRDRQPAQQAKHAQQAQCAQIAATEQTAARHRGTLSKVDTNILQAPHAAGTAATGRSHRVAAVSKAGKAGHAAARAKSELQHCNDPSKSDAACTAGTAAATQTASREGQDMLTIDALPQQQQQTLRRQQPQRKCTVATSSAAAGMSDDHDSCGFSEGDSSSGDESAATSCVSDDSELLDDSPLGKAGRACSKPAHSCHGHVSACAKESDEPEEDTHIGSDRDRMAACNRRTAVPDSTGHSSDGSQGEEVGRTKAKGKAAGKRERAKAAKPRRAQAGQEGGHRGGGRGAAGSKPSGSKSQAGRSRSQRSDTRQNFVRNNLKGGKSKKFLSKAGARGRTKKPSRKFGGGRTKFLAQAGDGADYLEGYKDPYHVCFKCGKAGHWAQSCPGLLPDGQEVPADSDNEQQPRPVKQPNRTQPSISSNLHLSQGAEPFVPPRLEGLTDEALAELLTSAFGHGGFRGQQLQVVRRVLDTKSTLAVLPTGSGKSLCYQLPALLLGGTSLVVSPLIALMRDQLARLPACLPAAMLWGGQSKQEAMQVLERLKAGSLRVLYVAPERLHSAMLLEALTPLMPLPLVCVDEAHCVAEWGHNFRSELLLKCCKHALKHQYIAVLGLCVSSDRSLLLFGRSMRPYLHSAMLLEVLTLLMPLALVCMGKAHCEAQ